MRVTRGLQGTAATALLVLAVTLSLVQVARAGGLSCSIGEVVIDNLKIGHSYSLQALANLPLVVTNTGDMSVTILVQPLVPDTSELRQGAVRVPSAGWASARPDSFQLEPHQSRSVDLQLAIPDDEKLFGRRFQINFWSHTLAQSGEMVAYGLKSRLIFGVDPVRDTTAVVPAGDIGISFSPAELTLAPLGRGQEHRLEDLSPRPLVVRNQSTRPLTVELRAISLEHSASGPTKGYADLMSLGKVTLAPGRFTLQPGEEKTVSGTLFVPRGAGSRGGKFVCVVSAAVVDLPVKTQIYSRLLTSLK